MLVVQPASPECEATGAMPQGPRRLVRCGMQQLGIFRFVRIASYSILTTTINFMEAGEK